MLQKKIKSSQFREFFKGNQIDICIFLLLFMNSQPDAVKRSAVFYRIIQVSQVTSGPRRGPTFNNRWWNDRRSWNLRTTNSREKASPKGANRIQSCSCSPPSGTVREYLSLSAGSIPFGHSTCGYWEFAPFGDGRMLLAKLQ